MKKYVYAEAKKLIQSINKAAVNGEYDTREKFLAMLEANPDVAAQGYNAYGKIFFWNKASSILYGHSEAAAVNKDIFETILPPEMRPFARDLIQSASKTGKLPEPSSCDLLRHNGEYVTVFSGHLMFRWENPSTPEFYCIDVGIDSQTP
jgi:PAS domain S-box-containing protein